MAEVNSVLNVFTNCLDVMSHCNWKICVGLRPKPVIAVPQLILVPFLCACIAFETDTHSDVLLVTVLIEMRPDSGSELFVSTRPRRTSESTACVTRRTAQKSWQRDVSVSCSCELNLENFIVTTATYYY